MTLSMMVQVARGQVEQMSSMRRTLTSPLVPASLISTNQPMEATVVVESHLQSAHPTITPMLQPVISFATLKNSEEENKKAAAAAVAAKLTASTSSAQMLTSVLSSLISEEAASKNGGLKSVGFTSSLPMFSPEKRPKLDKSVPVTDVNGSDMSNAGYFTSLQQQSMAITPLTAPTSMPPVSQTNHTQAPFPPSLLPPPPVPPANSPPNQFAQSAGLMMGVMPFGYGGTNSLPPPPPPLPSHIALSLARPPPQSQQQQQQAQQQQPPQPPNGGFFRPPGFGFFGQSHQPTPPPVPRQ